MLNLTPHAIVLRTEDGAERVIPPSGVTVHVELEDRVVGRKHGVPVIERHPIRVEGLPDDEHPCLVPAHVLSAVPGRAGVYAPDTGHTAIRDEQGRLRAVTRLLQA